MPSHEGSARDRIVRVLSSRALLVGILAMAAALRVGHVLALRHLPLFDRLIIDSEVYDAWARQIASGDWLTAVIARPFYMDPLYPYFLAALYRVAGRDLLLVRLVQVALGVGTCWLAARLATRLHGAMAGNVAAALLAVFGPSIFQEGEFEKTALGVFLATAALVLVLGRSRRSQLAAGAAFGLAALTRGNLLLLGPFAAVYLFARRSPAASLAFVGGALLVIAPVTWRNVHVSGEWVLTTASAGQNLYTGNNPANPDGAYHSVPFVRPQAAHEEGDFLAEAERRLGRRVTATEASSFWVRETVRHALDQPSFAARVLARKAALFWSNVEVADAWALEFIAGFSPVLRLPLLTFSLLLGLAVAGVGVVVRGADGRVVVSYVLLYAASVIMFFVFSRYRLHVAPALAALGGVAIASAVQREASARKRPLVVAAVCAVAVAAGSTAAFAGRPSAEPGNHAMLAEMYQERGDFSGARQILQAAMVRDPASAAALCAMSKLELRTGNPSGAVECADRCLRQNPVFPDGWYLLGLAWEAIGDRARAEVALRRQLEVVPGHELAQARLRALR